MNVSNRTCIRRLSMKSMKAARTRNIVAILAIALTTVLFTSLFTIALSINDASQQANFRQAGGFAHGTFKGLTKEQFDELKSDPLIKEYGLRRYVGMLQEMPFHKSHVEVGYSDANQTHWMFCDPTEGRLPEEGTNEAATDTRVLSLLGIEPAEGKEFSLTIYVDEKPVTETFTLSGWWEYDEAVTANHVLIPQSRAQSIFDQTGIGSGIGQDKLTGSWGLDAMFKSSLNIEQNVTQVLENHGFQNEDRQNEDNYVLTGVNWGYSSAQLAESIDPITASAIAGLLLVIIFTGYLIIYNVFQISVASDIRFYGLLKTIGTTGRQLRRILRNQAMLLSLAGIPLGLLAGYIIGTKLTPVILARLDVFQGSISANPLIFVGSAVFSLITVTISCLKPARMASSVSPIEAVRYTEGSGSKKAIRKTKSGASLPKMAWANLGRSRGKTVITIFSLSLAVLLLNMTVTFTNGFDMDKYVSSKMATDFIAADATYFQHSTMWNGDTALPEEVASLLESQSAVTDGGRVYGQTAPAEEFVTEEYARGFYSRRISSEFLDKQIESMERNESGLLAEHVQLYGMEPFAVNKLNLFSGDISKLLEPGGKYVAAVYKTDDYGKFIPGSHWAQLGDKITLRHIEEYEYYDPDTGEILEPGSLTQDQPCWLRAKTYRDVEYEVAALVGVPSSLSYRYYGSDEFVMNDQTFIGDTGTSAVLYYACDTEDAKTVDMEAMLSSLTTQQMPQLDYDSKALYAEEFESFRSMFLMLGGVLSAVVGLVGILNFLNAVLTGILTRRREFAILQSIGMTGRQLKTMLIWEGMYYALGAILLSLTLALASVPLASQALSSVFWFFTYRVTVLPILCVAPIFALLGAALPLLVYRAVSRHSVVERLRDVE